MKTGPVLEVISAFVSIAGGIILYQLVFFLLKRWVRHRKKIIPSIFHKHIYHPGLLLMVVFTLWFTLLFLKNYLDTNYFNIARHFLLVLFVAAGGFLAVRSINVFRDIMLIRLATDDPLDFSYRKAKTKFQIIQRILNFLIVVTTISVMLMTFESIRQVGSTLLASAGVLGLIIGFAAQKSLGTLFAGIQIAISQPIRIDDVVVVEGQFGTIGEISLTYVVVFTWDGRRLVIPINHFIEKSFENWTRESPEVIGKVRIYADYTIPVEDVRNEFLKIVSESEYWDRRKCGFLVTAANDKTIEMRATMSARDSGDAWELECFIREKLITYIQRNYPQALPRARVELSGNFRPERLNDFEYTKKN